MENCQDPKLLAELKEQMRTAKQLADVWTYFFDHFGEDAAFRKLGETTRSPFLEGVLAQIGKTLCKRQVSLDALVLIRLAEHNFIHGGCMMGGCLANVIYFEDLKLG